MATSSVERTFCTTRQAADRLGVSVGTVQLWVENGVLEAWKTAGGHRRVLRDSVDRLLRKKTDAPATPALAPPPVLRPLTVMVVEDDPSLLRLYEFHLMRWPMAPQVVAVGNAVTGLLILGRSSPDLLITDLHMPIMDGLAVLRVLRATPEVATTTIVVVSSLGPAEMADRGGLPSGIELLPKPVPFDRLQAIAMALVDTNPSLRRQGAPI
jgi:excisionase family DNA binding protein